MSHSKEPWHVDSKRDKYPLIRVPIEIDPGHYLAECYHQNAQANAERIVACVNFCAGVESPMLTVGVPLKDIDLVYRKACDESAQLRQELAKAKAVKHCEHCGSTRIITTGCQVCGAPVCCQTYCEFTQIESNLSKAEERIKELEAFEKWVKTSPVDHKSGCPALWNRVITGPNRKCTCGLSTLINSTKRK